VQPQWAVRVGLYGSWGLGKTTIADWISAWARNDGHIIASLKVGAESSDSIWHSLGEAIEDALKGASIEIEEPLTKPSMDNPLVRLLRRYGGRLTKLSDNSAGVEIDGITVTGAIVGGASKLLAFKESDIRRLREKLGSDKRVIVIIDDLDRIDGTILPRVLLAVRDVLDLPGFSFLLPFDDRAVIQSLNQHTGIKSSGESFLEKITDFHFRLPQLSDVQRVGFLVAEMAVTAPFVPVEIVPELESVLPYTPRRLKSIARHLMIFTKVV
jgi:hypothetical protein